MGYTAWSVTAGEQPTTSKWNQLGSNDAALRDGTGWALANNVIPGNALTTTAITLGYASITAAFNTTNTSASQVTGLASTVTIPGGGRKVKITAYVPTFAFSATNMTAVITIWDGAVGSGTQLQASYATAPANTATNVQFGAVAIAIVTPAAGSKTYNVGFHVSGGTGTISATTTSPAFILVEAV